MALTDLKKKSQPHGKSGFTADEFIDDANNYAMGMPRIVSLRQLLPDEDDDTTRLPMRHATFTLSQEAIDALTELSKATGEPKSKLIRKLILQASKPVKRSLAKQKKLQVQHQQIMDNSADMICVIDAQGRFLDVSQSCEHILFWPSLPDRQR